MSYKAALVFELIVAVVTFAGSILAADHREHINNQRPE